MTAYATIDNAVDAMRPAPSTTCPSRSRRRRSSTSSSRSSRAGPGRTGRRAPARLAAASRRRPAEAARDARSARAPPRGRHRRHRAPPRRDRDGQEDPGAAIHRAPAGRRARSSSPTARALAELLASELFGHAAARSPGPNATPAASRPPKAGRSSSTRSANPAGAAGQAAALLQEKEYERVGETRTRHATCASSPRPTATSTPSPRGASARTSSTASTSSRSAPAAAGTPRGHRPRRLRRRQSLSPPGDSPWRGRRGPAPFRRSSLIAGPATSASCQRRRARSSSGRAPSSSPMPCRTG